MEYTGPVNVVMPPLQLEKISIIDVLFYSSTLCGSLQTFAESQSKLNLQHGEGLQTRCCEAMAEAVQPCCFLLTRWMICKVVL